MDGTDGALSGAVWRESALTLHVKVRRAESSPSSAGLYTRRLSGTGRSNSGSPERCPRRLRLPTPLSTQSFYRRHLKQGHKTQEHNQPLLLLTSPFPAGAQERTSRGTVIA